MNIRKTFIVAALAAVTAGAGIAAAAVAPDDAIKARQTEMKANNKAMGALISILKGETPYDPAAVKAAADSISAATAAADAAGAWEAGTQSGTVKTLAKPEIWADAAGFAAARDKMAKAVEAVASTSDQAAFKQAFMQLGSSCKGCHETYRQPES